MNFQDFLAAGLGVVAGFDRGAALAAGLSSSRVRDLERVHDAYFGPTQFTRKQADARVAAEGMPLDQLVLIEKKIHRLPVAERWRLRAELLRFRGSFTALSKRADSLLDDPTPTPQQQCRFSRSRGGMRTMTLTAPERDLADLEHTLRGMIDPARPAAGQMADALLQLLRAGERVPHAAPRPTVLVPLPDFVRIAGGCGDDVTLTLTDGTTMTGADFLRQHFGKVLDIAAFHPHAGAVNLYRAKRFANDKQRALAKMMSPMCPFPDCRHGADACETHHVQAWKHGGETNVDNLVPLCRYHNGVNDDDPGGGQRGRIEIRDGRVYWISPGGVPVPAAPGAMELLFGTA